jgi:hypothetical protein
VVSSALTLGSVSSAPLLCLRTPGHHLLKCSKSQRRLRHLLPQFPVSNSSPNDSLNFYASPTAPAQTSTSTSPAKQPPAGAIAGGVIGGVVIFMGLALCIVLVLRRRRLENITAAQGYVEHKSSDISSDTSSAPFVVGPQLERGMGASGRKGDTSDLPTADWVSQRVQNNEDAPPEYPGRSPKR